MKNRIFLLIFFLFFNISYADTRTNLSEHVTDGIDKIFSEFGESIHAGVIVQKLNNDQILYQRNSEQYFYPASNQKLLTGYVALDYLKPNFKYKTQLFADVHKVSQGVLRDNVYLQFNGDPTLTRDQLDALIGELKKRGVRKITGKFFVDDSRYDQALWVPGSSWDDQKFCYGAPLSAIIIDRNCVNYTLNPSQQSSQPAILKPVVIPSLIKIKSEVTTSTNAEQRCVPALKVTPDNHYLLTGCMKVTDPVLNLSVAVQNPRLYAESLLNYLLRKHHIAAEGGVDFGEVPQGLQSFAVHDSVPLREIVTEMQKRSDNIIANSLFKTLGAAYHQQQATWENGKIALHSLLAQSLDIPFSEAALWDGAGASRYGLLTPHQISRLLYQANKQYNVAPEFISSLPISGMDGTLELRMQDPALLGKVRAKTGTATSASSLSGYVLTKNHETLSFVILLNGFAGSPEKYRALQEKICAFLMNL